ncbi:MAG: NPCBM/NEW2 domain-containing protein, partial [Nevskia sp.]|nr:NPCBM/NEW2 domain-containing protein [Nevskia sp.]
ATRVPGRSNSQGWGSLHIDQSVEGRPLRSGGRAWSGGFGTHAPSIIQLPVPSGAQRFTASAGLDDETAGGRLSFQVYADRQQLWDSGPINSGEAPRPLDLDIAGRATLQLVVDPLGDNSYDHADWLEPRFVMGR